MKVSAIQFVTIVMSLVASIMCGYSTEDMLKATHKANDKVIALTEQNFEKYLSGPRDYYIIMLLSSTSAKFNCPLCAEFKPEYELVAKSWFKDHPNGIGSAEGKEIFFMYSEFMNAKTLFQKMKLNNIPKLFALPPTTVSTPEAWLDEVEEYQFFQGRHSDIIVEWLKQITGHRRFNIYTPINYGRIAFNAVITFIAVIMIFVFFDHFKGFITSKFLWMSLTIMGTLLFTSGYMFTQIRHAPYVREHPDGHVDYFLPGQQTQLGAETQIVSVAYGVLSLLFVILVKKLPEISHPKARFIATVSITTLIYIGFSLFLNFVGLKSPYPLRFLRFF